MSIFARFRVPAVGADEARTLVSQGAALLDVRESTEWNAGHAPQAVHVPVSRLQDLARRVPKGKKVVVVCRSGNRSAHVVRTLAGQGYDAVNLSGGMHAWRSAGGAVVDRHGRPGTVA
ncbi:MAG: rhodanese-like domain-containing protein [Actinomycetia bacterium]|nr:rhodanese-like domain-containing protein [Actinomycetes bacterium]